MSGLRSAGPAARVLIVEDEASIRRGLEDVFRYRGFEVTAVEDGTTGLSHALAQDWDLVVLDIMLPGVNGFAICEQLRQARREMPVLILTAKSDEDDIVRGFEAGADDYITKPFSVRELAARANALLRRSTRILPSTFAVGPFQIFPERGEARAGELCVALSEREVRILGILVSESGRIVSRRALLRDVWDMNNADQLETRTVDVHIAKLRKKLGEHGHLIDTVRGQGYRLSG